LRLFVIRLRSDALASKVVEIRNVLVVQGVKGKKKSIFSSIVRRRDQGS